MAVDDAALFQAIQTRATKELTPKLRVGAKQDYWSHAAINWILNKVYPESQQNAYQDRYTTTLGFTVALSSQQGVRRTEFRNWTTLCHEIQHVVQAMRWTRVLFGFLYLWPLSQGILLALLGWLPAIWLSGWGLGLYLGGWALVTAAHFVPQLPDPWRTHWELEAYAISMHLYHMVNCRIPESYVARIGENFTSMMYYMMEPRKARIRRKLQTLALRIMVEDSPVENHPIVLIAEQEYIRFWNDR